MQGQWYECDGADGNFNPTKFVPATPNGLLPIADERTQVKLGNTPGRKGAIVWPALGASAEDRRHHRRHLQLDPLRREVPPGLVQGADGGDNETMEQQRLG